MSQPAQQMLDELLPVEELLAATQEVVDQELKPLTVKIDLEGYYPESVLRKLGPLGAYRQHLPGARPDGVADMGAAIQAMATVSHECMSTGFAMWCQDTCGWYVQTADNSALRDLWLPRIATGEVLAGTGMSNTMKAFAGIEPLRLRGKRVDGGYVVNGSLPWVSNLGPDHVFGTLFALEGEADRSVMALVDCATASVGAFHRAGGHPHLRLYLRERVHPGRDDHRSRRCGLPQAFARRHDHAAVRHGGGQHPVLHRPEPGCGAAAGPRQQLPGR